MRDTAESGCEILQHVEFLHHVTVTFDALPSQPQVAFLNGAAEMGDRYCMDTVPTPDIGQQTLSEVGRNGLPALASRWSEVGK